MKKVVSFVWVSLIVICSWVNFPFAEMVEFDKAKKVASTFLEAREKEKQIKPHLKQLAPAKEVFKTAHTLEDPQTKEVLGYIIDLEPKGFVFISIDTNIQPIIAYSYLVPYFRFMAGNVAHSHIVHA